MKGIPDPFAPAFKAGWDLLLSRTPETGTDDEKLRWNRETLPLLARPELGLPPAVQRLLLTNATDFDLLKKQRRRLVTDAILAAAQEKRVAVEDAQNENRAERLTHVFEARHRAINHGDDSPWCQKIEKATETARK